MHARPLGTAPALRFWGAPGFLTTTRIGDVFQGAAHYKLFNDPVSSYTLLNALSFPHDAASTLDGAAQLLLHAAVAAVLNAAHPNVAFGSTVAEIDAAVEAALNRGRTGRRC